MNRQASTRPILLYLVTEDWYFLSHRLPMALAAQRAGYDVHVATHVVSGGPAIASYDFHMHPLNWKRGSTNPLSILAIIRDVRRLERQLAPAIVHHVALEPTIIGELASIGLPLVRLNALAGLGFVFTSQKLKARLVGTVIKGLIRALINRRDHAVLVQNNDDRAAIERIGIASEKVFLIPGSGVETDTLTPLPEPTGPITVAFVGRLLEDKGLRSLIAAHERLIARGLDIRLLIAGDPDPANPASIARSEIDSWSRKPNVELAGHVADIRKVWAAAHIAVLPSRREGLPKSLLEAAACGRPIVATDVPGCREIARNGVNALLVPPDDPAALATAIERLAKDRDLRMRYGAAGRCLVEEQFSSERIGRETVALYDRLLGRLRS